MSKLIFEKKWRPESHPKIYLHPDEKAPKDVKVIEGPKGGRYYFARLEDIGGKYEGSRWEGEQRVDSKGHKGEFFNEWERPRLKDEKGYLITANGTRILEGLDPKTLFINRNENAEIQAIGRDKKKRLIYHMYDGSIEQIKGNKQERLQEWNDDLPDILKIINKDIHEDWEGKNPLRREMGLICRTMYKTGFRIGEQEDHQKTGDVLAYGVRSLLRKNVEVLGKNNDYVRINFVGKHGVLNKATIQDAELAKHINELGLRTNKNENDKVFSEEITYKSARSGMWQYMKSLTPLVDKGYKLHDFRTHMATEKATKFMLKLQKMGHSLMNPKNENQLKKLQIVVSKHVAGGQKNKKDLAKIKIPEKYLLNNPTAAKTLQISSSPLNNTYKNAFDSYISPSIWVEVERYMREQMADAAKKATEALPKRRPVSEEETAKLPPLERTKQPSPAETKEEYLGGLQETPERRAQRRAQLEELADQAKQERKERIEASKKKRAEISGSQVEKSKDPYTYLELFENVKDLAERVHYVNPPKKNKNNGKNKKIRREIDNLVERSYQKSFEDNNRSENWVQGIIEKSKIELQKQEDDDAIPTEEELARINREKAKEQEWLTFLPIDDPYTRRFLDD